MIPCINHAESSTSHLMMDSLVHLLFVVQDDKGLSRGSFSVEDEAEVASLASSVAEVHQRGV